MIRHGLSRRSLLTGLAGILAAPGIGLAAVPSPRVVATTGMIADAARAIGGEIEVQALMGPGVDPHAYRQTRSDIAAMLRADIVFWNGLFLEAQMQEFLTGLTRRTKVVAVAENVPEDRRLSHADYAGQFDPHVWMVPDLWASAVAAVRDALIEVRPKARATFEANADTYLAEVAAVGDYAREVLGTIPEASRVLITAHDAFGYLGREYGLEVLGIQGISTESEAGLARIGELVDLIVERRIGAVFVESSVSDRNVRALIEGARAQGHEVMVGGELYSDAMGEAGTYEGTYLGMIDHNVTTIAEALGGTAPEHGLNGKLKAEG